MLLHPRRSPLLFLRQTRVFTARRYNGEQLKGGLRVALRADFGGCLGVNEEGLSSIGRSNERREIY